MFKRSVSAAALGLLASAAVAAPASAAVYKIATADNGAVYVWNSSSATDYRTLVVKDNKADNASVYGNWSNSRGTGRVLNSSGAGTTAYRDTGAGITALQACVDYNNWPDPCSAWK